ncbi:MAG: hypothetical protein ABIA63_05110 [bacterium]
MFLILVLMAVTAGADIYYVDRNHLQASNSNSGSENSPWLTIGYAAGNIQAGDTVYIKTGTYTEVFNIENLSAAVENPTLIQEYPDHNVTIQ